MPQLNAKTISDTRLLDWFKPDERELARHDDPEKIKRLGEDMLSNGQLQAVGAVEDGRMIFGHGRWLSAKSAGIKTLEVSIYPATLSDTEFKLIRAAENLQRKELTSYRKWQLCAELMNGNRSWSQKDLAGHLHLSESMIVRLLSPSKCTERWQEALKESLVGISDCYAASKLPPAEQDGLLALKLSGASRDAIESAARKRRRAVTPAVRSRKITCPLAGGVNVTVSGSDMTLDEMIEALVEAVREAKKARDSGLHAKTFEASMRDRNRRNGQ
jgi:ParB/RepB/Spo0J family partition protein